MRLGPALAVATILLIGFPAQAEDAAGGAPAGQADYATRLDHLFGVLHDTPDIATAKLAEVQIWAIWSLNSGADAVAALSSASGAISAGDTAGAEQQLTALVQSHPDFAEAWNRRATLYYMMKRYDDSLADIAHVLELEPRHFGALSGKGMVLQAMGDNAAALKAFKEALAANPTMTNVKANIEALEKAEPEL